MKVSWNINPEKLGKELLNDVKATMPKVLEAFSKEVEVNAKRNFIKAIPDINGDNPYVSVSRKVNGNTATISCSGEQVLFAEFGAGIFNNAKEIEIPEHIVETKSGATYKVQAYSKIIPLTSRGFANAGTKDLFPRPNGIVQLGQYGKGRGVNEHWFYYSANGRTAQRDERWKVSGNGFYLIRTQGTIPVRGLWRARNTAINKLMKGRLIIK